MFFSSYDRFFRGKSPSQVHILTMIPNRFAEYSITKPGIREILIVYLIFAFLSSIIGDSLVLDASFNNGINLNKPVVVMLQHIAVLNLIQTIGYVLPSIISVAAEGWILGNFLAHLSWFLDLLSIQGINVMISVLTCTKLVLLKFPNTLTQLEV